jgi:hypothetical protein
MILTNPSQTEAGRQPLAVLLFSGVGSFLFMPAVALSAAVFSPDLLPISSPPKPRQMPPASEDDVKPHAKTSDDLLPVSQLTIVRKLRYAEQLDSC